MKNRYILYVIFCIVIVSCNNDNTSSGGNSSKGPKAVSELDTIQIPKYKTQQISQTAINSIKDWITFNELHEAVLTIGATNYTKRQKVERTNYLLWSEDYTNNRWMKKEGSIEPNAIVYKDTTMADGYKANDESSQHFFFQNYFIKEKDSVTFSVYIKAGASELVYLCGELNDPTERGTVVFDLKSESVIYKPDSYLSSIEKINNEGWYLTSISFLSTPRGRVIVGSTQSSTQFVFEGNGKIDFYARGAQLERGVGVGSYLPTSKDQTTIEEMITYEPNKSDEQIINSSYLKLYYQVDDIYQRIVDVESKPIPEKYNTPYIISRLRNLKTYSLLLTDALKNNSFVTNEEVNEKLEVIYSTYNKILEHINALNDTTLDKNINEILKRR